MKLLILKPSSLGDVIQALPVLRLLKLHLPASSIYWWIESNLAPLLEGDPDLAGTVKFERQRWAAPQHWPELWKSVCWMREQQFDVVLDLQCLLRSATISWLAKAETSIGLDEPREGARGFYDATPPRSPDGTHAVERYLSVLPFFGAPRHSNFSWLPLRLSVAEGLKAKWPLAEYRWLVLQPGARWENKRWPIEYFAELARLLAGSYRDFRLAVLGGAQDKPLGEAICRAAPERALDLTGRLTLPEMIEWIRFSEFMVTNDTGPMHVAAALGKPLVALFGPTARQRTGPYGQLDRVLNVQLPCSPCLKSRCTNPQPLECLRALSPALVFDTVAKRLRQSARTG